MAPPRKLTIGLASIALVVVGFWLLRQSVDAPLPTTAAPVEPPLRSYARVNLAVIYVSEQALEAPIWLRDDNGEPAEVSVGHRRALSSESRMLEMIDGKLPIYAQDGTILASAVMPESTEFKLLLYPGDGRLNAKLVDARADTFPANHLQTINLTSEPIQCLVGQKTFSLQPGEMAVEPLTPAFKGDSRRFRLGVHHPAMVQSQPLIKMFRLSSEDDRLMVIVSQDPNSADYPTANILSLYDRPR